MNLKLTWSPRTINIQPDVFDAVRKDHSRVLAPTTSGSIILSHNSPETIVRERKVPIRTLLADEN